ncbi:TPA: hypothetical protein AB5E47_003507 [Vibrio cholerae]
MSKSHEEILKDIIDVENISETLIKERFGNVSKIEKIELYKFDAYKVLIDGKSYFIPQHKISTYSPKKSSILKIQKKALTCLLPLPLSHFKHIGLGVLRKKISELCNAEHPIEASNNWLVSLFNPDLAASFYVGEVLRSPTLNEYKDIILEAITSYFMGMNNISTLSLFPVLEGSLRDIHCKYSDGNENNVKAKQFIRKTKEIAEKRAFLALKDYNLSPLNTNLHDNDKDSFYPLISVDCDVLYAFVTFFQEILYKESNKTDQSFNRHLAIHLLKNDFGEQANFVRLIMSISYIVYIEDLHNNITPFDNTPWDQDHFNDLRNTFHSLKAQRP